MSNAVDAARFRNWSHDLYHNHTERFLKELQTTIANESRDEFVAAGVKDAIHAWFASRMPAPGHEEVADMLKFRDKLLSARDTVVYKAGVMLTNTLSRLYLADYAGEVEAPSDVDNERARKMVQMLREKEFKEDRGVYVTPDTLAAKSEETRSKSKGKLALAERRRALTGGEGDPSDVAGVEESKS